jgi:uncharacterized membrane protein YciS (DUF1049 family)
MLSFPHVLAATGTVLVTTLDDCVWLVPFVAKPLLGTQQDVVNTDSVHHDHAIIGILHGVLFAATLTAMAAVVCISTALVASQWTVSEDALTGIGAILCWMIAAFLWIRKILKKPRNKKKEQQQEQIQNGDNNPPPNVSSESDPLLAGIPNEEGVVTMTSFQPCMIVSLTILGSLDEISYYPSLILGRIFTPCELILGTCLAAVCMMSIVVVALQPCKPCMECLDRIPLCAVVATFAILLTIEWILS